MQDKDQDFRSVILTGDNGEERRFSVIFRQDEGFLCWNRLIILATRQERFGLLRLRSGRARFRLVEPGGQVGQGHTIEGEGFLPVAGARVSGAGLDDESVYDVGELSIHEYREQYEFPGSSGSDLHAVFAFLQRPSDWPRPFLEHRWDGEIRRVAGHSDIWHKPRGFDLRFRLATVYHRRRLDDAGLSEERFWLPAVETRPAKGAASSPEKFHERSQRVWFLLRILIAFYFKQLATLFERSELWPARSARWYWPKALLPTDMQRRWDPPFRGESPSAFFSKAVAVIEKENFDHETLYAAAHAYTFAFSQGFLENAITSFVEGIERLLEVFERWKELTRKVLEENELNEYRKKTKYAIDQIASLQNDAVKRGQVKRHVNNPPILTLGDRIERMRCHFSNDLAPHEARLFDGLSSLIKTRNNIVHGRLIKDVNLLYVENARAQALFEKLFLSLLGSPKLAISGDAARILEHYENPNFKT